MSKRNIFKTFIFFVFGVFQQILLTNLLYGVISAGNADIVLGQFSFSYSGPNLVDGIGFNNPMATALDETTGRVYLADSDNNRVLWWNNMDSLTNGKSADGVLGQPDLYSCLANHGSEAPGSDTLSSPEGVVVDSSGNVWVADTSNNRILKYNAPISNGMDANIVLGQADFITNLAPNPAAGTLARPKGLSVDSSGNLWVADSLNNRVLKYNAPISNGADANIVLGQAGFTTKSRISPKANNLYCPYGVAVDTSGNVWVADYSNYRVLGYNAPISSGMNANIVLGQADFTSHSPNRGGPVASNTLEPYNVVVDKSGNIWVTDWNNRVLEYNLPISSGMDANMVLGQANFTNSTYGKIPGANLLAWPTGLSVDSSGNVWVADTSNNRILKYNAPISNGMDANVVLGQISFNYGGINFLNGSGLSNPCGMVVDINSGRIYVTDGPNNRVLWWNSMDSLTNGKSADGVLGQPDLYSCLANQGSETPDLDTLFGPNGVAVDSSGNVWVADTANNRVLKYSAPVSN
ncbi:MAG: hypothetical protein A3J83_07585, partial [Elusimicrobia bacterium RIFOXYA2_FULL_40_6]